MCMDTPIQYFVYLRKSSEGDDKQALSIESQQSELAEIIKREQLTISDTFEESHSAKLCGTRKVFNQMVKRIEKGNANGIFLWNINRLSRNAGDAGTIIDLMDRGLLHEIKAPGQSFRNNPQDKFLLNLFCSQAKLENDNKGVDVKRGLKKKVELGWRPCNPLTGYRTTPEKVKGLKTIEIDPITFPIIKRYFKLLLKEQAAIHELYRDAIEKHQLTCATKTTLISKTAFYSIFQNPFYYGEYEYPLGSGKWHKGKHTPVLTKHEFIKLQTIISKKPKPKKVPTRSKLPYRKLFTCGECGMSITGSHVVKRQKNGNVHEYLFYHCTKKSRTKKCSQGSIRQEVIEETVENLLKQIWIPSELAEWLIEDAKKSTFDRNNNYKTKASVIQKNIASLEQKLENLLELRIDGELGKHAYQEKKIAYETEITQLTEQLDNIKNRYSNYLTTLKKEMDFAQFALEKFKTGDNSLKREYILHIGSNLSLMNKKPIIKPKKELLAIQKTRKSVEEKIGGFKPLFSLNKRTLDTIDAKSSIQRPRWD